MVCCLNWRNIAIARFDPLNESRPILGERNRLVTSVWIANTVELAFCEVF